MSWINFSQCKSIEEISQKLMERFNGSESHVAMATAFAQHLLQKDLLLEQNKYQEKQLQKMEKQNEHAQGLVKATWVLVIISLLTNLLLIIINIFI